MKFRKKYRKSFGPKRTKPTAGEKIAHDYYFHNMLENHNKQVANARVTKGE